MAVSLSAQHVQAEIHLPQYSQCTFVVVIVEQKYSEQVAQLSQRYRAARWVSYGQKWKT